MEFCTECSVNEAEVPLKDGRYLCMDCIEDWVNEQWQNTEFITLELDWETQKKVNHGQMNNQKRWSPGFGYVCQHENCWDGCLWKPVDKCIKEQWKPRRK